MAGVFFTAAQSDVVILACLPFYLGTKRATPLTSHVTDILVFKGLPSWLINAMASAEARDAHHGYCSHDTIGIGTSL